MLRRFLGLVAQLEGKSSVARRHRILALSLDQPMPIRIRVTSEIANMNTITKHSMIAVSKPLLGDAICDGDSKVVGEWGGGSYGFVI